MKVTVTGGAGFIGSNLVHALIAEGHEVCVIDDLRRGHLANLANLANSLNLSIFKADLRSPVDLDEAIRGADAVFHLAALKNTLCQKKPDLCIDINVRGTVRVLEACVRHGVERFFLASSASVYGAPTGAVQDEDYPTFPVSIYGVSKLAAEHCARLWHRQKGLATTILRYCHVYGPRCDASDETGDVIPIFIRSLHRGVPPDVHGDGLQERSFTYVDDAVKCSLLAMKSEKAIGATYNCASGFKMSVLDVVGALRDLMGKRHIEPKFSEWRALAEVRRIAEISNRKIGRELGFDDWTPIDVGLKKTVNWYRERWKK